MKKKHFSKLIFLLIIAAFIIKAIGVMVLVSAAFRIHDAYMIKGRSDSFRLYAMRGM